MKGRGDEGTKGGGDKSPTVKCMNFCYAFPMELSPSKGTRGEYWGLVVGLLQYFPLVKM